MSRSEWIIDRTEALGRQGMVVAQHELAAEVGVGVLADGGNAIDAAVATAFALGVVEPFMSGIGGGGLMLIYLAGSRETVAIDFGMCAPLAAHPDLYALLPGTSATRFGWRAVEGDANVHGPLAIAVPGTVAGLVTALERYGTRPLADLLQPAIRLARDGFPISWHTSLEMAQDAALLARYPSTRAVFTRDGLPLPVRTGLEPTILRQPDLARSLEAIAREGAETFYRGELGRQLVEGLRELGAILTMEDLERYAVRYSAPLWGGVPRLPDRDGTRAERWSDRPRIPASARLLPARRVRAQCESHASRPHRSFPAGVRRPVRLSRRPRLR